MKAYVTSIGESTRDLCVWSLERNGFEVVLIENGSLLVDKLKVIYELADDDFVRIDADVVPNKNLIPESLIASAEQHQWWIQYETYDWNKQDLSWGGAQFIKKEALPFLRTKVDDFHNYDRPETMLSRIPEFHNPRRFESCPMVVGIHSFAAADIDRVKAVKERRNGVGYDWELANKLLGLLR
jgi:hypothetical protein